MIWVFSKQISQNNEIPQNRVKVEFTRRFQIAGRWLNYREMFMRFLLTVRLFRTDFQTCHYLAPLEVYKKYQNLPKATVLKKI